MEKCAAACVCVFVFYLELLACVCMWKINMHCKRTVCFLCLVKHAVAGAATEYCPDVTACVHKVAESGQERSDKHKQ